MAPHIANVLAARSRVVTWLAVIMLVTMAGCLGSSDDPTNPPPIPDTTKPCQRGELWPYRVGSARQHPFLVHYRSPDEREMALKVVGDLDAAWDFEVKTLGFPEPLDDAGECGPDGNFDVFVWRGRESCFVNLIHDGPEERYLIATPWGGRRSYMVVDPWGKYGGEILAQTIAHEFNHASHAVQDWYEAGSVFEMTATYVEQYFRDALDYNVTDFQLHPDWAVLWYDDYRTYYMYGSGLYMYFLRDYYFSRNGTLDAKFASRLWSNARNTTDHPLVNKPNLVDALDSLLAPVGDSFVGSIVPFARWRYYAGSNDDRAHFKPWQDLAIKFDLLPFLPGADIHLAATVVLPNASVTVDPPPMLTGSAYVEVVSDQPGRRSFQLSLQAPSDFRVRWVVQAVPGLTEGSDGEIVDLGSGSAVVQFAVRPDKLSRTLIVTAMPTTPLDPDDRTGQRFPVNLAIRP